MSVTGDAMDPYLCTAVLRCPQPEARRLRRAVGKLLEGIDPTFRIISILEETALDGHIDAHLPEQYELFSDSSVGGDLSSLRMLTPSLAIGLFLQDKGSLSADAAKSRFRESPWKFHHSIELSNNRRTNTLKSVARQEFNEIRPKANLGDTPWPLWSVSTVHYGNEHIRFTLFTKDYSRMVEFYRCLTGKEAECTRENFCFFEMYSQPGLDIQLALKASNSLDPRPPQSCNLCIKGRSLRDILCLLETDPVRMSKTRWMVQDPDGNHLVVEEATDTVPIVTRAFSPDLDLFRIDNLPMDNRSHQIKAFFGPNVPRIFWQTSQFIKDFVRSKEEEEEVDQSDVSSCCQICKQMIDVDPTSLTPEQTGSFDSGFSGFSTRSVTSDTGSEFLGSEFTVGDSQWESDDDSTLTGVSSMVLCPKTRAFQCSKSTAL